jgi:hypothetical protein
MTTSRLLLRRPQDRRRLWSTTSSTPTCDYVGSLLQLFFHCSVCLVVTMIYDPFTYKFLGCNGRCSASVAHPSPYSGIRVVLHSFLVWIFCCMALIGSMGVEKRRKLIVSCDWMASSCSFFVVCVACPYWLESPSGLAARTVSGLSHQAEVMCNSLLMKIETFWWLRFGLIGSIQWDFHRDFVDVIYEIPCGVCCSEIIVSVEIILHLPCFYREWYEWYSLNIMRWFVCNICATCELQVNTTGLRLFDYCITTCVSTCDAWSLM